MCVHQQICYTYVCMYVYMYINICIVARNIILATHICCYIHTICVHICLCGFCLLPITHTHNTFYVYVCINAKFQNFRCLWFILLSSLFVRIFLFFIMNNSPKLVDNKLDEFSKIFVLIILNQRSSSESRIWKPVFFFFVVFSSLNTKAFRQINAK